MYICNIYNINTYIIIRMQCQQNDLRTICTLYNFWQNNKSFFSPYIWGLEKLKKALNRINKEPYSLILQPLWGGGLPAMVFCPLHKISLGNPYLVLDLSKLLIADAPI